MNPPPLQDHFDALLKIYADFSLREFRFKEGRTEEIREEAKRQCAIYMGQCANYIREQPELQPYFFGPDGNPPDMHGTTIFSWEGFSSKLAGALARMQEDLDERK